MYTHILARLNTSVVVDIYMLCGPPEYTCILKVYATQTMVLRTLYPARSYYGLFLV